jgi:hypothetical protein
VETTDLGNLSAVSASEKVLVPVSSRAECLRTEWLLTGSLPGVECASVLRGPLWTGGRNVQLGWCELCKHLDLHLPPQCWKRILGLQEWKANPLINSCMPFAILPRWGQDPDGGRIG